MPKIISTSRYMRDTLPTQLENYVRYIGTRGGAEKIDESKLLLPATINQKNLIRQLIRDIPTAKEMLKYTNFLLQLTIGNAPEPVSYALEQHPNLIGKRENYTDYIASRPRVEYVDEYGLFTDAGQLAVLTKMRGEVAKHKGVVWTHVASLRREDAARFGHDSAKQWMTLLRSRRAMLCEHMRIDSENLRWYAAFHNEDHHPRVHLMVYSAKDNDGYLTKKPVEVMRSESVHDILHRDFVHLYDKQNRARAELKTDVANVMKKMMKELRSGTLVNPGTQGQVIKLSERLQNTDRKEICGYLKRDVKSLVDRVVDELMGDSRVDVLYQAWGKWQNGILLTCQNTMPSLPFLSRQPQFKSTKSMAVTEVTNPGGHQVTFEDETVPFIGSDDLSEPENG